MRYRLGRSHSDTIYRQLGESPSEDDPRVAVFWEVIDAIRVVRLLNGDDAGSAPPDSQATVNPKLTDAHAPAREVAHASDVVDAIMDTIDAYPAGTGPERAPRTRAHVERLIREYAASERAAGVEEGRRAAGEVVSVPPPSDPLDCPDCYGIAHDEMDERDCCDAHTDEPPVVPPLVDALLKLLDEYSDEIEYGTAAESACDSHTSALYGVAAKETRDSINRAINALWATGVEEGRRLLDETAATAAAHAYELGIAEGGRRATEERTEEKITPATAYLMPRPRGYVCAAGCGHADSSHRELGCDVDPCECPAPFGRILPSAEATDHG